MFDTLIEICQESTVRDKYNEKQKIVSPLCKCWAEVTENGGRTNLYASRIVTETDTVFTVRYRGDIKHAMYVYRNEKVMRIKSIRAEGRRKYLHISATGIDVEGLRYDDAKS